MIDIDAFDLLGAPSVAECIPRDVPTCNPEMEVHPAPARDWVPSSKYRLEWWKHRGRWVRLESLESDHLARVLGLLVEWHGADSAKANYARRLLSARGCEVSDAP